MSRALAILALVIIMLLLLIAAFAGTPTDADAADNQIIYTYSTLTATTAEATICQRELTGEGLTAEMFIYPWEKGMPLELHLEFAEHNGDCWTFTGEWQPQPGNTPWTYQADSNFKVDGTDFYYDWHSASYSRSVFIPMAFRNIPDERPAEVVK